MRIFTRDWVECFAVVMLCVTSAFTFVKGAYGTSVIAGTCAGLVAGMLFAKWVYRGRV